MVILQSFFYFLIIPMMYSKLKANCLFYHNPILSFLLNINQTRNLNRMHWSIYADISVGRPLALLFSFPYLAFLLISVFYFLFIIFWVQEWAPNMQAKSEWKQKVSFPSIGSISKYGAWSPLSVNMFFILFPQDESIAQWNLVKS